MIFKDMLSENAKKIDSEFSKLLEIAFHHSVHKGDLLLVYLNGFYDPKMLEWNERNSPKLNPHVIGVGQAGQSEGLHYEFIHKYRMENFHTLTHSEYLNQLVWSPEKKEDIEKLIFKEEHSIQLEMLIYLKVWEADLLIKRFYQLTRLLYGESYDWYFKISNSSRDAEANGTRQEIWRKKIRNRIRKYSPFLEDFIKETYKTQIRNSIAHSNYSFLGRNIHLNNFIKGDPASQLSVITFDEWAKIFHNTLLLHNQYIIFNNAIDLFYGNHAKSTNVVLPILVTEKDGTQYELPLEYRTEYNDWHFAQG